MESDDDFVNCLGMDCILEDKLKYMRSILSFYGLPALPEPAELGRKDEPISVRTTGRFLTKPVQNQPCARCL